jgi:urease alpha subunit
MFATKGRASAGTSLAFVSSACADRGFSDTYRLRKKVEPVRNCRNLGKKDMRLNDATPHITVDPETFRVTADGEWMTCDPIRALPLARRFSLF